MSLETIERYAPVPLRLALGIGFLAHGVPKLGARHEMFAGVVDGIGVPLPELAAWLVTFIEVIGGAALLLGVFVVPVGGLLIADMVVAIYGVHWDSGFNFINIMVTEAGVEFGMPGWEANFLYIAALASLMLSGPGPYTLSEAMPWLARRREGGPG